MTWQHFGGSPTGDKSATSLVDGCFQLILITMLTYLSCFRYKLKAANRIIVWGGGR